MKGEKVVYLKDYRPPSYRVDTLFLEVDLFSDHAVVTNTSSFVKNPDSQERRVVLNGVQLELLEIQKDGKSFKDYEIGNETLSFEPTEDHFILKTTVKIDPLHNKSLEGFYHAKGGYYTQNEPEGFRRITYHVDRPDVMSAYTTKITASKEYGFLLSNGNLVEKGDVDEYRHYAVWQDPYKKPSYLFAMVVGNFVRKETTYTTKSGKKVDIHFFVDEEDRDRVDFAMESLKQAMKWDEDTYDLEYDLGLYMVVATSSFNMGAMENKGLNIFNSQYVLANVESASDDEFDRVRDVIGHEYFHNWTGDRVTCRDWFQLSLKEGLTVFREYQFSGDSSNAFLARIKQSITLKERQFAEAAGPNSHPVRPRQYLEINNFYTTTVYEKGSEVIRMLHTLIGDGNFKKGIKRYFELYDGMAVTIEDFVGTMLEVSKVDLQQFKKWYDEKRTPVIEIQKTYDSSTAQWKLRLKQTLGEFQSEETHQPLHIPIRCAFFDGTGQVVHTTYDKKTQFEHLLELRELDQTFVVSGVGERGKVSLLRGFSAPVILKEESSPEDDLFFYRHENDGYSRYEAGQRIHTYCIQEILSTGETTFFGDVAEVYRDILKKEGGADASYGAILLRLPGLQLLSANLSYFDYPSLEEARKRYIQLLLGELYGDFKKVYTGLEGPFGGMSEKERAKRTLKNLLLSYMVHKGEGEDTAYKQYFSHFEMNDKLHALYSLSSVNPNKAQALYEDFYNRWSGDDTVICKYLVAKALESTEGQVGRLKALVKDPIFNKDNPNKVLALYRTFFTQLGSFHRQFEESYDFLAEMITYLNVSNPIVASALCRGFNDYRRLPKEQQEVMRVTLEGLEEQNLSRHVYEKVSKILGKG